MLQFLSVQLSAIILSTVSYLPWQAKRGIDPQAFLTVPARFPQSSGLTILASLLARGATTRLIWSQSSTVVDIVLPDLGLWSHIWGTRSQFGAR